MSKNYSRSNYLRDRAHDLIPGGSHTYSKADHQFPAQAPAFIARGLGSHCWDVDGNEFVDWGMGLRSVVLGHAYEPVLDAVRAQLPLGSNFTRPSPIELQLAEAITELIPSAEMVKFAKNGSDVTSAAVRLARAHTGRDLVARSKDSAFFSFYDWFIGSTPTNAGVPAAVRDLTLTFAFNDLDSLRRLFAEHAGQIACVILEPATGDGPAEGYLQAVKDLVHANGAVLIFDEVISGFRWHIGGAQAYYGVTPDLSTFGKAMGNGFSVSALVGRRDILELGGIRDTARRKVFLLSATHGAETHELAASLATIREMTLKPVIPHLWRIGAALKAGINAAAQEKGLTDYIEAAGPDCSPVLICRDTGRRPSNDFRTLFLQETISLGVLMPWIAISFSHSDADVDVTVAACRAAMDLYQQALDHGSATPFFEGPPVRPVFTEFN